jgi:hypothetical protein
MQRGICGSVLDDVKGSVGAVYDDGEEEKGEEARGVVVVVVVRAGGERHSTPDLDCRCAFLKRD